MKKPKRTNISYTVQNSLCLGCGICSDICPTGSINMIEKDGEYRPVINPNTCNSNKGCRKCLSVCPGLGVDFNKVEDQIYKDKNEYTYHKIIGYYKYAYSGYAMNYNIRYHSASGGALTAFISYLLDKGYISAAVVTKNDVIEPYLNRSFLAHSLDDLISSRSSKYAPVKFDGIVDSVKKESGKVIIVGLPCVIHGYRKYESIDSKFKEKVLGYFGLYCSCSRSFNLTNYVLKKNKLSKAHLKYFQYRDNGCLGNLVAEDDKRTIEIPFEMYYHPLRSFFIPNRCLFCIDHYAELADVSFGDIHYGKYKKDKIGVNSFVIRNKFFNDLLENAQKSDYLKMEQLSEDVLVKCQPSALKKKKQAPSILSFASTFLGLEIPDYGGGARKTIDFKSIAYYLFARCQMFVGKRKWLWWIIPLLSKKRKVS